MIHIVKGFDVVNKADLNVFLELSCFFDDPIDVCSLISGSLPFLNPVWELLVRVLLKSQLETFEKTVGDCWRILSITLLACEMTAIVWWFEHSLALPFFGIGMKTDLFQSLTTADFSKFSGILSAEHSQHHILGFEIAQVEFHHLHWVCS